MASDLGPILREARERAGLSLAGIAARTGYSRSYLGNVETGKREPTPGIIRAYQTALGEDVYRRNILVGAVAAFAAGSIPDVAADVASGISAERSGLLASAQTSHEMDLTISSLVARDAPSVASLSKWMRRGSPVLRVNAAGILAKMRVATLDNAVAMSLRADHEARELYLTAVTARVLQVPWNDARAVVRGQHEGCAQLAWFGAEVGNERDSGARWCSVLMLSRWRHEDPAAVDDFLVAALRREQSREVLRSIGTVLAGRDPLAV